MDQPAPPTPSSPATASAPANSADLKPAPSEQWRVLIDQPWVLLAILFLVTAALGLPLLWMSRAFNTWAKIALTIAVLAWTAIVLWLFYLLMAWCWSRLEPVLFA